MRRSSVRIFLVTLLSLAAVLPSAARRKPLIGVAPGYDGADKSTVGRNYTEAIVRAGGIPLILPQAGTDEVAEEIVSRLDGILLTGGVDLDPSFYGESVLNESVSIDAHRDEMDMRYVRVALKRRIPILAICRGEQIVNVALGGSLYQDLPSQKPGPIAHRQGGDLVRPSHRIIVSEGSMLHRIMKKDTLMVNSSHHQAVKVPSDKIKVTALAEDGVVEAYEGNIKGQWLLAVQFHPEALVKADDSWLPLFEAFVKAAR